MDDNETLRQYIQATLPDADRAAFEAELSTNADLRAELALAIAIKSSMDGDRPSENVKNAGWDRLSAAIGAEQIGTPANDNRRFSLLQVAGVAAAAVLAWQLIAAPFLFDADGAVFTTASSQLVGPSLRVTFAQGADISDVTKLLRDAGGTILGGPSAIELYTIGFEDADRFDAAQTLFEANSDLLSVVSVP